MLNKTYYILCLAILLTLSLTSLSWSKTHLRQTQSQIKVRIDEPPLYLPETKIVKLITLGFDNLVSDILWFNTVSYFGKHLTTDRDYRWLKHMCTLVYDLDPNKQHVVEFCASMLSWAALDPKGSNVILDNAIKSHPNVWRYYYLRGFNYWFFLEDHTQARKDLETASKLPEAPALISSLASRLISHTEDPQTAIAFLTEMIKNAKDKSAQSALLTQLKRAHLSNHLNILKKAASIFKEKTGSPISDLSQLVSTQILKELPQEPFGGKYYLDSQTEEIKTTSNEKGLEFFGKTAFTSFVGKDYREKATTGAQR